MSATYNELLLTNNDKARSRLGDTDMAAPLHSDEHIAAVIEQEGGLLKGVRYLANELIAKYGQQPKSVRLPNGLTVDFTERIGVWKRVVTEIDSELAVVSTPTTPVPPTGSVAVRTEVCW
ncbi:MAG TPA: hypothetical protein VFS21_30195 [Roseiflexaceae bacterium]|nr:hypothetical protein [Roseiflexaceae bacterium]